MPRYQISTPEQVSFHYTVAGVMTRCLAWITDLLLIWAGYIAVIVVFAQLGGGAGAALILIGWFVLDFGYFSFFELYWAGQSPGKKLFAIRVISARGNKLYFTDVLIRNLMRPVDMLPIAMATGGTTAMIDKWHRRLGDLMADTLVVRDVRQVLPQALGGAKARVNSFQTDAGLRSRVLMRVTRAERDLIMDLALRRDQMDAAIRESLFAGAAAHFRSRLSLPSDADHLSDEQTVVNLALLIQESKFTA